MQIILWATASPIVLHTPLHKHMTWKLHGLQSVWKSVGHVGTATVKQPDAAVSEVRWVFALDVCTQCLKQLTVMVYTDLLLSDLKSSSRGPSVFKECSQYYFTGGHLWLYFLQTGWSGVSSLHFCCFLVGSKWGNHTSSPATICRRTASEYG